MYLFADSLFYKKEMISVVGWVGAKELSHTFSFRVSCKGKEVPFVLTKAPRPDVSYSLYRDPGVGELGYFVQIPCKGTETFEIIVTEYDGEREVEKQSIHVSKMLIRGRKTVKELKAFYHAKKKLLRHYLRKDYHHYGAWFELTRTAPHELQAQRTVKFAYAPLISILVPVYHTPVRFLHQMIASVRNQTYGNFELILSNASPEDSDVCSVLSLYESLDSRIRVLSLPENRGISENTNAAFREAKGEFVALLDHDDTIEADTLYEYVKRLNEKPDTDLLYCDEDKCRAQTDYYYYPNFKPDFNIDMLFNNNYICHMLMLRRSLVEKLGGWNPEFDGAQDYDLILRAICETRKIEHIAKVLYHWRSIPGSTSKKGSEKNYAEDAGMRAIQNCYERLQIPASVRPAAVQGWYVSEYQVQGNPKVSVLIPNKDHTDDLDVCLRSLCERCTYQNLEILVIENNSTEPETFRYYEAVQKKYPKVKVITYTDYFNYSRINNVGFAASTGDYIMLLNNDTEVISENLFESMLGYCQRPEVGMVGARLLYQDGTVQHAGVLAGAGGLADHYFKGEKRTKPCYMCRSITTYDVSAVTAACLMLPRKVYEEVGGLEETLAVAFNDVDFCMKVRAAGYLIVYDAQAELYHYESKSRGSENTPEKFIRFGQESVYIHKKWHLLSGFQDPYYNPNMSYLFYFDPDQGLMAKRENERRDYFRTLSEKS